MKKAPRFWLKELNRQDASCLCCCILDVCAVADYPSGNLFSWFVLWKVTVGNWNKLWDLYDRIEAFYDASSKLVKAMRRSQHECSDAPHQCLSTDCLTWLSSISQKTTIYH